MPHYQEQPYDNVVRTENHDAGVAVSNFKRSWKLCCLGDLNMCKIAGKQRHCRPIIMKAKRGISFAFWLHPTTTISWLKKFLPSLWPWWGSVCSFFASMSRNAKAAVDFDENIGHTGWTHMFWPGNELIILVGWKLHFEVISYIVFPLIWCA